MLIKQITNYPRLDLEPGSIIDWDDTEAARMVAGGLVERVEIPQEKPVLERATQPRPGRKETR